MEKRLEGFNFPHDRYNDDEQNKPERDQSSVMFKQLREPKQCPRRPRKLNVSVLNTSVMFGSMKTTMPTESITAPTRIIAGYISARALFAATCVLFESVPPSDPDCVAEFPMLLPLRQD